jgi:hypothetical protein
MIGARKLKAKESDAVTDVKALEITADTIHLSQERAKGNDMAWRTLLS